MKKKLLSFILTLCCVVSCTFILSACAFTTDKNNNENDDTSAHNFSEEWVYDDDCHWHTCLDDGCEKESKHQSHNYGEDGKCIQCGTLKSSAEYLNISFDLRYAKVESIKAGAPSCIKIPTYAKNDKGENS